ncbi:CLUMA_CG006036, isoform A [Clunio marinus]|uniref:CLUMA_CG006036, isoform A n=1 Tax=Clunio marinus TaxID=568069 RepID=A0A1J1HWK3_9DIPT|nr:CLUMA_CG006036, isoform A [Clunio marinus]
MSDDERTLKQKIIFYTTAFFVLLGTFSLFSFLFLVPFVIEPAFQTIFMKFDENRAQCFTDETISKAGTKNCTWTSCREGCTRDIYTCTQIYVNYKIFSNGTNPNDETVMDPSTPPDPKLREHRRRRRSIAEYDYVDSNDNTLDMGESIDEDGVDDYPNEPTEGLMPNSSEFFYRRARLFPNVKGCGYPPFLNCTIWNKFYQQEGANFSCYYSTVDPRLVVTHLDMWKNSLHLILAMAIPIPSFIISVIYLTFAYFKIYNEDEENEPLDKNAEEIADDDAIEDGNPAIELNEDGTERSINKDSNENGQVPNGNSLSPSAEANSFGHQLKVQMADEMSRESLEGGLISNSESTQGNMAKTMMTSITTPPHSSIAAV